MHDEHFKFVSKSIFEIYACKIFSNTNKCKQKTEKEQHRMKEKTCVYVKCVDAIFYVVMFIGIHKPAGRSENHTWRLTSTVVVIIANL